MRRIVTVLPALAAVVASSLVVSGQTGGYQIVPGWMKLPSGFILGTPQPAPTTEEMAATRAFGVQPYFETGFPHGPSQFISATATAWAAIALTHTAR